MSLSSFQQFPYDTVLIITFQQLHISIYISLNVSWVIMTCDIFFLPNIWFTRSNKKMKKPIMYEFILDVSCMIFLSNVR